MVEENQQKIQKLEEAVKEDLNVKCNDIIKKSSQGVVSLQERYDGLLEKFSKRMGLHEHQVTELQVAHEQGIEYKKKKVEKIEKELMKLSDQVGREMFIRIRNLENDNKQCLVPIRQRIQALSRDLEVLREPIITEGKNMKAQNEGMLREMKRL